MKAYLLRRLLLMIPTLLGISLVCFTLIQLVPGGPVEEMIGRMQAAAAAKGGGVDAGLPAIRAYPSAAPVATPSNRQSTARMGELSRAATKCISEVPGFVKQVSIPALPSVSIKAFAPFIIPHL